jgi:carbamoyl-phosphate synthase large subunit
LAEAPESLRLVGTDANRWHLPLSVCHQTYLIPPARERSAYAVALGEIIAAEGVKVAIPTHPVEVRALAELRDAGLLAGIGTALPRKGVLETCDDKFATFERLGRSGIAVPRTLMLDRPGDIERAFDELGDIVWIRGSGAPGLGIGGAALPCRDVGVGQAWVEHHRGWGRMSASEYLPGANLTWMGGFCRGRLVAAGTRERLEYVLPHVSPSGITGAPAVSRTIYKPAVAELGERAVRAVDPEPHGSYFVDMKTGGDGVPRITEINAGRCGTTVHFYTRAGYNFPWFLVRLARGETPESLAEPNQAVERDLYWVRTLDCGPVLVREPEFDRFPRAPHQ